MGIIRKIVRIAMMMTVMAIFTAGNFNSSNKRMSDSKQQIRIIVGTQELTATLHDNAAARDFIDMLPLTVELRDYASTGKDL